MSWLWFDLCSAPVAEPLVSAAAHDHRGQPVGLLCAWRPTPEPPTPTAAKLDERAIDASGGGGWVSLARSPGGTFLPFDDPAVAQATRMVLGRPPTDVFTTLIQGDARCVGSFTGTHGIRGDLAYDPFANLFPAVLLEVEAGILGHMPAPVGPVTQRYGAENPWPWDRF